MTIVADAVSAVMAALSASPAIAAQVERVRLRPLSASSTTAVVVRPLASEALESEMMSGYPISWQTAIAIECYARSSRPVTADASVDALITAVYGRLMADPTLAGAAIVLQPQGVSYDFDVDGEQTACATFVFLARQRTTGANF